MKFIKRFIKFHKKNYFTFPDFNIEDMSSFYREINYNSTTLHYINNNNLSKSCHLCKGSGWININESQNNFNKYKQNHPNKINFIHINYCMPFNYEICKNCLGTGMTKKS